MKVYYTHLRFVWLNYKIWLMSVQHIKHWTNFLRFDFCCFSLRGLCQWNSTVCWATAVREAKTKGAGEQKSKNKIRHLPPLRFSLSRSPTPYPTLCRILKTVNIYVPLSEFSCLKKRSSLLLDSDRSNLAPLRFRFGFYNSIVDLYFFVWLSVIFCERAICFALCPPVSGGTHSYITSAIKYL